MSSLPMCGARPPKVELIHTNAFNRLRAVRRTVSLVLVRDVLCCRPGVFLQQLRSTAHRFRARHIRELRMKSKILVAASAAIVLASLLTVSAQGPSQTPTPSPSGQTPGASGQRGRDMETVRTMTLTGCLVADTAPGSGAAAGSGRASQAAAYKLTNVAMSSDSSGSGGSGRAGSAAGGDSDRSSETPSRGSGSSAGQSSSAGRAGSMAHPSEYRLTAASGVDLAEHVNHTVRVTGTTTGMGSGMGSSSSSSAGSSAGSSSSPGPNASPGSSATPGQGAPSGAGGQPDRDDSARTPSSPGGTPGARGRSSATPSTTMAPAFLVQSVTMVSATCQ
jgi:hypothetical protein